MQRALLSSSLLLAALVGCQTYEDHYARASLRLESNAVNVFLHGKRHKGDSRHPCAPGFPATALVNGIPMEVEEAGGFEDFPDSDEQTCLGVWYQLDLKRLPADTASLEITFEAREGRELGAARDWRLSADWPHTHVWTESDLATAMRMHEEFVVRWEPADEPVPALFPVAQRDRRGISAVGTTIELVEKEPGRARFRFGGARPPMLWNVEAQRNGKLENKSCRGFEECEFFAGGDTALLHPVGIPPVTVEGVAPLRECLVAPGADPASYKAPRKEPLPDLSTVRIGSNMSCDGADLYFVVLGACGVCGGGKSTVVVGNRGTQAASFRVRSNAETIEGELLEPEQISAPLEIAFEGRLSQIEILADGDCDATSNAESVASIACTSSGSSGALPLGCNNTCPEGG